MAPVVRRREGDHVVDSEKSSSSAFRWLDAARYVVSAVVVVLIVTVAVRAIIVVLRPDKLTLFLPGSCVYTQTSADRKSWLDLQFNLRAENPSGRARMYFLNVTAYLFDNTTKPATETTTPGLDSLVYFLMDSDVDLPQMQFQDKILQSNASRDPGYINLTFFDALSRPGGKIYDATMRVEGSLITETSSGHNTTPQLTTYYCRQLTVGVNLRDQASTGSQTTSCTTL